MEWTFMSVYSMFFFLEFVNNNPVVYEVLNMQFVLNDYKNELLCSESIETCSRVPIPKINENENYIFVSYSHKDYKYVFSDLADMYSSKVRFWYDKGLTAGKSWDDEVTDIIEDSRCAGVVFFLSDNFFVSDSIFREVQFVCEEKRKNFFCVNLTTDNIETLIDRNVMEDARRTFFHQHFQQKKTYLVYKSVDHYHELIEQIANQYNVVSNKIEFENGIYHGALKNGRRDGHGVCIYSDGSRYDGEWKDDQWDGYGEFQYSNGDIYRGNWMNGKRHGDGELTLVSSGESYKGSYKEDLFDGYGIYRWEKAKEAERKEYCGYYHEGKHHGKGKMIYADGSFYDGEWVEGKKEGYGTNSYCDGTVYTGEFYKNKRNGKGKYTYLDGDIYIGEWVRGNKEGAGEMQYASGDSYTGEWKQNKYSGYGTYKWANPEGDDDPETYEGYFLNGERDGQGRITYPSGGYYDGNWEQGWRSGYGECLRGNGDKYCGEWLNGEYHGKGTILYANGEKYEGEWKSSQKEGQGVFTYADGNVFVGTWQNDSILEGSGYRRHSNGYYVGEIKNGMRNGYGVYVWLDEDGDNKEYSGEWLDGNYHGKGVMLYKNGDKYDGEWVQDNKEGAGEMQYASGDSYTGEWKQNKYSGYGTYKWANPKGDDDPETYEGYFLNGEREGQGRITYPSGGYYDGNWHQGWRSGYGECIHSNGNKYCGEWLNGDYHGKGVFTYADGHLFEGVWKNNSIFEGSGYRQYSNGYYIGEIRNGNRNGYGIYVWTDTNIPNKEYSGEWVDGNYHGKGVMLYRNGDKYDGEWRNDKKHGIGEFCWENPAGTSTKKYDGNYENDVICGHGFMMYANGDTYEGEFLDGNRNGIGTYKWNQNALTKEYTGQWLAGDYHGKGTMLYANGEQYEGEWNHNKRKGRGKHIYANGQSYEGTWENDSLSGIEGLHTSIAYLIKLVENIYAWRIPFYLVYALICVSIYYDFFEHKIFDFLAYPDIDIHMDYLGIHVLYQCICMIGVSGILLWLHRSRVYNKWYYCAVACISSVFILSLGFFGVGELLGMNEYAVIFMGFLYPLYVFFVGHCITCIIRYVVFKALKYNKSKTKL